MSSEKYKCTCGSEEVIFSEEPMDGNRVKMGISCRGCGTGVFQIYEYRTAPDAPDEYQARLKSDQTCKFKRDIWDQWDGTVTVTFN